jgi:hypothetical protein
VKGTARNVKNHVISKKLTVRITANLQLDQQGTGPKPWWWLFEQATCPFASQIISNCTELLRVPSADFMMTQIVWPFTHTSTVPSHSRPKT